ncbi:DUF5794 domain-containing protein [Halovenus rubra]|uniref:DUF5794 domain-containing protein n=2 Tax=Halovenus rubra TaxID=869890 RepID=A0ABD5XE46_9EURY|nr:DUF5794 domain-containing protein [Halovenus rubra]
MSNSQHPRALSIERWVSDSTRLLAVVLCLPLVDGVFVAVVLGGALDSLFGIVEVGLLVFGGSAMVAVILAEMDGPPKESMAVILAIGSVVIAGAGIQATLAPTIESAIDMATFERFAALVILGVAAATASAQIAEYLPSPALVIALGFLATVSPSEATFVVQTDLELIARAMAAASVGVAFGLVLAATSPWLRDVVELDRFRFGSAVALGVLAVSIVGYLPSDAPVALLVLGITALLAFDPTSEPTDAPDPGFETQMTDHDGPAGTRTDTSSGKQRTSSSAQRGTESDLSEYPLAPISDGREQSPEPTCNNSETPDPTTGTNPGQDRPPWL